MVASEAQPKPSILARWAPLGGMVAAGAIYGLALARFLFERDPQRFELLDSWPGVVLLAALALAVAVGLGFVTRRFEKMLPNVAWAPIALALPLLSLVSPDVNPLRSICLLLGAALLYSLLLLTAPSQSLPGTENRALRPHTRAPTLLHSLGLFLLLLLLYVRTLAPAVGLADTFEFQVGVARLGIAHGSGYPLLMLVGRLFTLLPAGGTLAYRANLSSAFFAALAAVGVARLARKLGAEPVVALLAGLSFGVSPTLWSRAVEIEVFALNAAFVAAILCLCIDLILPSHHEGSTNPSATTKPLPRLMLLAFLFGLSLTNHLTCLFLAPACLLSAWVAIRRERRLSGAPVPDTPSALPTDQQPAGLSAPPHPPIASWPGGSALVLLSLLIGLSVYLYLPLRWPAVNHGEPLSLAGFANILSGNEAKGAFNWRLPFQDPGRYAIVWGKLAGEYGWPGVALATLGVLALALPARAPDSGDHGPTSVIHPSLRLGSYQLPITNYLVILLVTSLGYVYFELAFNVPDPSFSSYIIPLHLITAVLMALGVQWLMNLIIHLPTRSLVSPAFCLLISAFSLLPLRSIWDNFPAVDKSSNWAAQRFGELMLSQPLAHGAAILADSQKIAPLDYLQIAEGRRPDLDIVVLPDEASYRAALDERLAAGQVVYLGRYLPGLGAAYSMRSIGPLAEVSPAPFTSAGIAVTPSLAQPAIGGISLLGYANRDGAATLSAAASDELDLTLLWQARVVPPDNLLVNLRLVNDAGQPAWQSAGSVPVSGLYPINAWRAGEFISDFYRLPMPPSLAPGNYQLQVALAAPFASISDLAWTAVASVTITPPANAAMPSHLLRARLGSDWLLGYDMPEGVAPGSHFTVTLYWLQEAETNRVAALGETHSLAGWPDGSTVPVVYHLTAPASGDRIDLTVDRPQAARCGWLAPTTGACALPPVRLAGQAAAEGAVNFDNQILLNHARLQTASVTPGGSVKIDLEWQALRAIGADYTVFVHLLGPDGLVHGQVDLWPVSGTRATSGWAPGERMADPYTLQLPADAPPGAYQVEVGLYLLATGERLPVLNAEGVPVDNRLLLGGLEVKSP